MSKAASVHSRIDADLKHNAEEILHDLGLTASQAISAFYAQIVICKGIPFELKIPNRETRKAMEELEKGGGKTYKSFQDMIDDLGDEDA